MSSHDRTIRRLTALQKSASTARVLNLAGTHNRLAETPEELEPPFFEYPPLNRCIIVKHRLRSNERDILFNRNVGTKVLLPMDSQDLKIGAQYFFVGQRDFDAVTQNAFGRALAAGQRDRQLLELIDELPSLDPFLLREHLRRNEFEVARAYFNISDADIERMYAYVQSEITPLVAIAFRSEPGSHAAASKLVNKILSSNAEADLAPLRSVLRLDAKEFLDGIFAWRGFLYYKWSLIGLEDRLSQVLKSIQTLMPRGPFDRESSVYISAARIRIADTASTTVQNIARMLDIYTKAYAGLTNQNDPGLFREFLLRAPQMFMSLGEQLGALQHIESDWKHRLPEGKPAAISQLEFADLLVDFEESLAFAGEDARDHSGVAA